ncbi:MAG TPA: hypothetical protein VGG62_07470 [Terracidiphilus sp.]|jgi:hypothetical protein
MLRIKPPLALSLLIPAAACALLAAQTGSDTRPPQSDTVKTNLESAGSIKILSADEMTRHDRDLEADAEASIQERAGFQNLEFNQASWTYRQLVCPALPNHLFLRFSRNEGTGEMSMFSAAIPRGGEGKVRIIPIVRKGYSLFSPAPIGALTIASFNRIRSEETTDWPANWLGTALCYAALAGANPQAGELPPPPREGELLPHPSETEHVPVTIEPTFVKEKDGGTIVRFADVSTNPHPMEWNLIFDSKGRVLKATHSPAYVVRFLPQPVRVLGINDIDPAHQKP